MSERSEGEYEEQLAMRADPERIFDFIADVRNLPLYVPTTKSAQSQGRERVRLQGEAQGHRYDGDGYLRPDRDRMRLEWGADEGYYSGWMQIEPNGSATNVRVHISLRGSPGGANGQGPSPGQIQEGLRKGLQSIRNHVEGKGGKEEPSAAT